jgi:hypothetical protein
MRSVNWEIYIAYGDNPCAVCAPLDMQVFREGEGPQPPMHPHCLCKRQPYAVEYVFSPGERASMAEAYHVNPEFLPGSVFSRVFKKG